MTCGENIPSHQHHDLKSMTCGESLRVNNIYILLWKTKNLHWHFNQLLLHWIWNIFQKSPLRDWEKADERTQLTCCLSIPQSYSLGNIDGSGDWTGLCFYPHLPRIKHLFWQKIILLWVCLLHIVVEHKIHTSLAPPKV